jgi:putative ABC transport system permease protein
MLACIGLYGLLSYEVTVRSRELGIRMALGAQKRHLIKLVVRHGLLLSLGGLVLGLAGAFAITRLMTSMLYHVRPNDPETFVTVSILLLLVALAACSVPALRAVRVDPLVAIRNE